MSKEVDIDKIALQLAGGLTLEQLREKQGGNPYETRFEQSPTIPITDEGRAHLQRVATERPIQTQLPARQIVQEMEYDAARKSFWGVMQVRAFELSQIECREFEWQLSNEASERIKNIVKYFINDPESAYPLQKGLFVMGAPGTGKSEVMGIAARFCAENKLSKEFEIASMSKIYVKAKIDKDFDPVTPYTQFNRCLDEFGRHVGGVVRFGDSININEAIIEERYERMKRYGQITHLIANMTTQEAADHFPPMVFDRLREMCTSVVFAGQSKRQ